MGFGSIFNRKKKRGSTNSAASSSPDVPSKESLFIQSPMRSPLGNFTQTQLQEIEGVFKKFDPNGDGKISASELGSILKSLGQRPSDEELDDMIREFDGDGDGFIDFHEFIELNTKGIDYEEVLENLKDAFSVYDIDGDGSISAEELHEVLQSLGDECSIAECRKMISGVDNDGNGMIDFEEFKLMMMAGATVGSTESDKRKVAV
ncbi:putative calcium-binding protein CML25 [Hibiscus syriacus]|uniref:Calcium-binding protein CML25 n=1 Tax=Hibiscus syriacus TaxID=106335 RepID=A0A6A2WAW4_HIBSY|nr:probable calcium-binding protein CML25 [Hibiscus syriacus]KAE8654748.1 putative calcium-binding protein CML25 [Hibiscus syriacus]